VSLIDFSGPQTLLVSFLCLFLQFDFINSQQNTANHTKILNRWWKYQNVQTFQEQRFLLTELSSLHFILIRSTILLSSFNSAFILIKFFFDVKLACNSTNYFKKLSLYPWSLHFLHCADFEENCTLWILRCCKILLRVFQCLLLRISGLSVNWTDMTPEMADCLPRLIRNGLMFCSDHTHRTETWTAIRQWRVRALGIWRRTNWYMGVIFWRSMDRWPSK
jgi:hypothetical protein